MDLLLVEDEAAVANLYLPHLEKAGWRTHWVATVGAGTAAVLQRSYDAVILDLLLREQGHPDGDGLDVLRTLRTRGIVTPVIILSAFGTEELAAELGEEFGVVTVLAKPFERQTLLLCLAAAAAAAAAKTAHDPLAVALEELARVDFSSDHVRHANLGILLRSVGDRVLPLRSFARLSQEIARLVAQGAADRARICDAIRAARDLRATSDRELDKILAVLAVSDAAARELARVCEMSVKSARKRLRDATGHGIGWWRRTSRVRRFVIELLTTEDHVDQCAFRVGYGHGRQAARDCRSLLALAPKEIRGLVVRETNPD